MSDSYYGILCDLYTVCDIALTDCAMPNSCADCKYIALCADIRRLRDKIKGVIE